MKSGRHGRFRKYLCLYLHWNCDSFACSRHGVSSWLPTTETVTKITGREYVIETTATGKEVDREIGLVGGQL